MALRLSRNACSSDTRQLFLLCGLSYVLLILFDRPILAQHFDSFEGGEPRWILVESDCQAELTEHGMSLVQPHSGRTCEMLQVKCNFGTMALLAYPIEPCMVADEFQPRIWTRCSSGRIQIGVRIVFPFAEHPVTHGRLSTILWGDIYQDTGSWQMLKLPDLELRKREALVQLRQKFGANIKLDGEYIDSVVLNVYTGPGSYRVQLDDLELHGMIPMAAVGTPPPRDWRQKWRWRYQVPTAEERYWATPNRSPTWLQHRGESLAWVESMGFTGVLVDNLPSGEWLAEARKSNLGVLSPPPPYPVEYADELLPVIRGWVVGAALDKQQAQVARSQAHLVASLPQNLRRPLIAEALEDFFMFSRIADELIIPVPMSSTAGDMPQRRAWMNHQLEVAQQRSEGWVSINVGLDPYLSRQIEEARSAVQPELVPHYTVDPLGLHFHATSAIVAGARGVLFRTQKPLESQNAGDSAAVAAISRFNNDMDLWGPWITGGQAVAPPNCSAEWTCAAWNISQSKLIIVQSKLPGSQHCVPSTHAQPLELNCPLPGVGQQLFRLTNGSLERLDNDVENAKLIWSVEAPNPVETFLITSNPMVLRFVRNQLAESVEMNAASQLEIANLNIEMATRVISARHGDRPVRADMINDPLVQNLPLARRQIDQGWQALRSKQPLAGMKLANSATDKIQNVLYDSYKIANLNLASPQTSPFVVSPVALDLHWAVAAACARNQWQAVELPGSQFSDLARLLDAGWSQERRLEERLNLRVELLPSSSSSGPGLRLAAYSRNWEAGQVAGGYEGASLRIRSAATPVKAGQLIRVSAKARVISSSELPNSGLLVYDNQVGQNLGQMINGRPGDEVPVELYRWITNDGEFRLLAECRGECDIVLASIECYLITPASNQRNFKTAPYNSPPRGSTIILNESASKPAAATNR